ncbi:type IV secretion system protein [Campylobacter upsaliensis]|nr:type IV secretion system protein [Campylobacter upsaliensis]
MNEQIYRKLLENAHVIIDWAKEAVITGYNILNNTIIKITANIENNIFEAFSMIFFNSIAYNLIGILVVIWLIYHMRNGFSRDDIFKATIWVITLCFVYGVLSSYSAFAEFKSWFLIPSHILQASLSTLADGKNTAQVLADTFAKPSELNSEAILVGIHLLREGYQELNYPGNNGGSLDDMYNIAYSNLALSAWTFLIVLSIGFLVLIIFIIQVATQLSLSIFGCFAPIMVMCLIIPQTRAYFFSWLKNYISISLYLPLSLIPLLVIQFLTKDLGMNGAKLYLNTGYYTFIYLVSVMLAFMVILKLPEWINIIMGTQEGHSNMAMAQNTIAGAWAMSKFATGKGFNMAKGSIRGAVKTGQVVNAFRKDPKGSIKKGLSNIVEKFGFKASSHFHDK